MSTDLDHVKNEVQRLRELRHTDAQTMQQLVAGQAETKSHLERQDTDNVEIKKGVADIKQLLDGGKDPEKGLVYRVTSIWAWKWLIRGAVIAGISSLAAAVVHMK